MGKVSPKQNKWAILAIAGLIAVGLGAYALSSGSLFKGSIFDQTAMTWNDVITQTKEDAGISENKIIIGKEVSFAVKGLKFAWIKTQSDTITSGSVTTKGFGMSATKDAEKTGKLLDGSDWFKVDDLDEIKFTVNGASTVKFFYCQSACLDKPTSPSETLSAVTQTVSLSATDLTLVEGDTVATNFTLNVSPKAADTINVTLLTSGVAVIGTDYTITPITQFPNATFIPGQSSVSFSIATLDGDTNIEPEETATVAINEVVAPAYVDSAASPANQLAFKITDNDTAVAVPTVKSGSYIPAVSATGVSISAGTASVEFEGAGTTFDGTKPITLKKHSTGAAISTANTFASNKLTLTYASVLEYNTLYDVFVSKDAIKNVGGSLATDVTWSFTTAVAPTGVPTVKANTYVPAANATGVSVSSGSITLDFEGTGISRDTSKSITLKKDGTTTEITTTKDFSTTTSRLTISYTATLENSTKYNVFIDNEAIKNSTGPLSSDVTWSFTTVSSSTIPQVRNLEVDEDTFNPDDNEEVEVSFDTDKKAYISAYIKDEDARVVREFEDEFDPSDLYDADDYSFDWNGEDDDGDMVDDGDYKIYVKAKAQTGNDADIESIEVTVDTDGSTGGNDITDTFKDLDDIDDDELLDAIAYVYDNDIFDGYSNKTFRPDNEINRAEMVKVLVEAFNVKSKSYSLRFTDIDDSAWYNDYLETAVAQKIVSGDSGKRTFRPSDSVNRVETLKMVFETLGVTDDFEIDSCNDSPYSDADEDEWYIDYVCLSDDYDLFDLVRNKFNPDQEVTRGEMALVFFRLSEEGVID